jgi:hypothetical protein
MINELIQPLVLGHYPAAVVKVIKSICGGPSQVHFFPGFIKSRDGQFFSSIYLDEELLQRVYGANELATLRRSVPAFSLPEHWVLQSLPGEMLQSNVLDLNPYHVPNVMVTPSLNEPTMSTGDLPDLDEDLLTAETIVVLASVMSAGLNRSAASILISSWANEVWGMLSDVHRRKFLTDPSARYLDAQAFIDPEMLSSIFKVSHLHHLQSFTVYRQLTLFINYLAELLLLQALLF